MKYISTLVLLTTFSFAALASGPKKIQKEDRLLNETFRIDLHQIDVDMEHDFNTALLTGHAELTFSMRPEQTRALFHLDQNIIASGLNGITLNGEALDISDPSDVRLVTFEGSSQLAVELQRDLGPDEEHIMAIDYTKNWGWYMFTYFTNDIQGVGGEFFYPTINTPSEYARHHISIHMRNWPTLNFIGSGLVEETAVEDGQKWQIDTEEETNSANVFFCALPDSWTDMHTRDIAGVEVRIMELTALPLAAPAYESLETWIPQLQNDIGEFPMERGLSILMLGGGGGMEFYGATFTSMSALRHEVFHMYFATSVVFKTYRDSWVDEAVTEWYEGIDYRTGLPHEPIPEGYTSDIVTGRSAIAPGFDTRAYGEGAQIMASVTERVGGRENFTEFLSHMFDEHTFSARLNTEEFVDALKDYSGVDLREEFKTWVFQEIEEEEESELTPAATKMAAKSGHAGGHYHDTSVIADMLANFPDPYETKR